jgi:hypothetical protein
MGPLEGLKIIEMAGLGPEDCMARNPRLVYGRMTGWGQYGPLAKAAGHDINYISLGAIEPQQDAYSHPDDTDQCIGGKKDQGLVTVLQSPGTLMVQGNIPFSFCSRSSSTNRSMASTMASLG